MKEPHMSIPVTWTESYTSFIEIEIPPLFATSREAATDYVKKAVKAKKIDLVNLAFEQKIHETRNNERLETLIDFSLDSDNGNWWGPW